MTQQKGEEGVYIIVYIGEFKNKIESSSWCEYWSDKANQKQPKDFFDLYKEEASNIHVSNIRELFMQFNMINGGKYGLASKVDVKIKTTKTFDF